MIKNPYKGKFIVFEGPDGSGTTTQANLLFRYLKKQEKLKKVYKNYLKFAKKFKNIYIINGEKPIKEVFAEIKEKL